MNTWKMEDFEPYDCGLYNIGRYVESEKKSGPTFRHHQHEDHNEQHPHSLHDDAVFQKEDHDEDDIILLDCLFQSPLLKGRVNQSSKFKIQEGQEEEDGPLLAGLSCFSKNNPLSSRQTDDHQDVKNLIARKVTPTFKPHQDKKRKKSSDPGTHLASTLNFPYKSHARNKNEVDLSKRLKIWDDEADQGRILEKHFNSDWQLKFLNEFYGSSLFSSHKNNKKNSHTIRNKEEYHDNDRHCNKQEQKIKTRKVSRSFLVADMEGKNDHLSCNSNKKSADKELSIALKKASLNLLAAMDLTDISRNKVFKVEDEIKFDRKKYLR